MPIVNIPGKGQIDFPDNIPMEIIETALGRMSPLSVQREAEQAAIQKDVELSRGGVLHDDSQLQTGIAGSLLESPERKQARQEQMGEIILQLMPAGGVLKLDKVNRMGRAKEMGFDTSNKLFHGTNQDIKAFDLQKAGTGTRRGANIKAVFLADDPHVAAEFPVDSPGGGKNLIPAFVRPGRAARIDLPENIRNLEVEGAIEDAFESGIDVIKLTNYTTPGGQKGKNIYVVKDPKDIRSVNAKFDPNMSDSTNILSGVATGLLAAGIIENMFTREGQ